MHVFGLTGGIATGKSTVAERWRERGLPIVDADKLARAVVSPGSEGIAEVAKRFGDEVVSADGTLNRIAVAAKVFSDPAARRALEGLIHPRIHLALITELKTLEHQGYQLACYEAPLLVEVGSQDAYRPLVVVSATPDLQLERARERDSASTTAVRARIDAQLPLADKEAVADYVICNNGSRQNLLRQADQVLDAVSRRLGLSPGVFTQL